MKIVVFTADEANGGVKQLVSTITRTCIELGYKTTAFFPENRGVDVDEDLLNNVIWYRKDKSLNPYNKCAKVVSKLVEKERPDLLIMPEGSIFTLQVLMLLSNNIKTALFIHDVTQHPSNMSFKRRLTYFFSRLLARKGLRIAEKIVVLSKNSYRLFSNLYPNYKDKVILYTLGGHVPFTNGRSEQPEELRSHLSNNYALFFGRIDKYKGLDRLARAYQTITKNTIPLVIAGRGRLDTDTEGCLLKSNNVFLLNRFIKDEEMIWLFDHCKFVVLPYIQASQSGVLPISYAFGKPVIASNIDGIKEYVDEGRTGFLFNNEEELGKAILELSNNDIEDMSEKCKMYSNKYFNWKTNTQKLVQSFI